MAALDGAVGFVYKGPIMTNRSAMHRSDLINLLPGLLALMGAGWGFCG